MSNTEKERNEIYKGVRVKPSTSEWLDAEAEREGRSVADIMRRIIERAETAASDS